MSLKPLSKAQLSSFRSLKQGKYRKQSGLFLLEGLRLCREILDSNLHVTALITHSGFADFALPEGPDHFVATRLQMEQLSDSRSPQGIICIAKIPTILALPKPETDMLVLALDRIADPGNLGTIMRSALWFGVDHIILGPDCVDPYSPKVVRSSMGAIGSIQLHQSTDLIQFARTWKAGGGSVAALHMEGHDLREQSHQNPLLLIVGSEAHGVQPDLMALSQALSIKKQGRGESLNAAMAIAIALYELTA